MIADLFAVWRTVLTRPSVPTFDEQKPNATNERTLTGVIIAAIASAVLAAVFVAIFPVYSPMAIEAGAPGALTTLVRTFIQTILGFYVFCYVLQFVATRLFGGQGVFDQQAYLISTYWVPISIVGQGLVFIRVIGPFIGLLALAYGLVLTTFAVQSGQRVSVGNAILSWVVAAIVTGIILAILGTLTGGWL